jgi:hypothetical protein
MVVVFFWCKNEICRRMKKNGKEKQKINFLSFTFRDYESGEQQRYNFHFTICGKTQKKVKE